MLTAVLTMTNNFVMGNGTELPWGQSERVASIVSDITKDNVVVCGSATWIAKNVDTENAFAKIVLSSMPEKLPAGYDDTFAGLPEAIIEELINKYPDKDIVFIGGMGIFTQFLQHCHNFHVNVIDCDANGDKVFQPGLQHYLQRTSFTVSSVAFPEIPTFPKITSTHYRRSIH